MSDYPSWETIRDSIFVRAKTFPRLAEDMPTFLGVKHAIDKADLAGADAVIIGAPYAAGWGNEYAGVHKHHWIEGPKRVRQQSIRYHSGYIQDFDLDIFDKLTVVDYGDADIPEIANYDASVPRILEAQAAVEAKVNDALEAGAVPIVIGQNSPCGSYAVAKPVAERTRGKVGMVSLDTHWDISPEDRATNDARIAGSNSWKHRVYRDLANFDPARLVEIGERGLLESKAEVRGYLDAGACFVSAWRLRTELGIAGTVELLDRAFDGTDAVYAHFDMDVLGGAGPTGGDILGELAEPIGLSDYEVIRIAHEIAKRGCNALSFICIPPGSPVIYRVIVYVISYFLAGLAMRKNDHTNDRSVE